MIADVGMPVPDTPHAVSVSLPSWKATVGYEEGEEWVVSKMKTGYPRFFIHLTIQELEREILKRYGNEGEKVMLFPSRLTAQRCRAFFDIKKPEMVQQGRVRSMGLDPVLANGKVSDIVLSSLHCVFFPKDEFPTAKQVWQHSGDGISSRRGEFLLQALKEGILKPSMSSSTRSQFQNHQSQDLYSKGPRRYQRGGSQNGIAFNGYHHSSENGVNAVNVAETIKDCTQFIEERFGRNLNAKLTYKAKVAIKRRITGCFVENADLDQALESSDKEGCKPCRETRVQDLTEDDVYLYPCGMSAIFNSHRLLMALRQSQHRPVEKTICFGFPYIDTLKILEKWGPGCLFYGNGVEEDLDDLERRLEAGERYLALFTEFPSNPLLRSPNLLRIRELADKYDFAVVIDETVGNFININVLAHADVVVSSLTKIFSGDSNVMGGSYVLNPQSRMYDSLREINETEYEDNYWAEDAVFMERNSRDFISRIERVNVNAEAIADRLKRSSLVKGVYYPKLNPSRNNYDACRNPNGGYGGLLSTTFFEVNDAIAFFDNLEVQKGPSLGTNFTLACPYAILAHYTELDWVASFGVDPNLVRISVGLEETEEIIRCVEEALAAVEAHRA